jgi:pimeloyl-ACP methyl ester carboxylesterase
LPEAAALFLHGGGGGGWEWRRWSAVWRAHGITVHAPDLQPQPAGLGSTRWEDYAGQVRAQLDCLPSPRILVGASLGGLLAAEAAASADALILINPLPPAPLHRQLPARDWPEVVPWRRLARLPGTRAAMPGADSASALAAFRHWRDESGPVLRHAAAGVEVPPPACPTLVIASLDDTDVPAALSRSLAQAWQADWLEVDGGHVDPLLGRQAATLAAQAVDWLNRRCPQI